MQQLSSGIVVPKTRESKVLGIRAGSEAQSATIMHRVREILQAE